MYSSARYISIRVYARDTLDRLEMWPAGDAADSSMAARIASGYLPSVLIATERGCQPIAAL